MKDTLFIAGLCILIVGAGALFYFLDPSQTTHYRDGSVEFRVVANGQYAQEVKTRTNYRIRNREEFSTLWSLLHGNERPPLPSVDFGEVEVLAVFDGSHSTGGYGIMVTSVTDTELTRVVRITHQVPGDTCVTSFAQTSPYQLIAVPIKGEGLRMVHEDSTEVVPCP